MIAILLASTGVVSGRLKVAARAGADPHVPVRRRNGEAANAGQMAFGPVINNAIVESQSAAAALRFILIGSLVPLVCEMVKDDRGARPRKLPVHFRGFCRLGDAVA